MRSHPPLQLARALLAALLSAAAAQAAAPGAAGLSDPSNPGSETEVTVQLDPYEVQADSDTSYGALNSNSITDFSTALNKLPISADIFDQSFMNDVGVTGGIEQMISTYSAGAGFATATPSATAATEQEGDRNNYSYVQLRGMTAPSMQRDGLMVVGAWYQNSGVNGVGFSSAFDLDRVEIINGPQSLLYGPGGAGGVINTVSKQARLGQPAFGSLEFQVDQYGHKLGQLDYGVGTDAVAARFAFLQQDVGTRRVNIGGPLAGYYGQIAIKAPGRTVIRVEAEETTFDRTNSKNLTLTAASTSNDARNGQYLAYLLASNQMSAAANGAPSGAGAIDNGLMNWNNLYSYAGDQANEFTINRYTSISAATTWNDWLSTKVSAGYDSYQDDWVNNTMTFYAPNVSANTLGTWAMAEVGGLPMNETEIRSRMKSLRGTALITNDWLGGTAHSQTNFGLDYVRGDTGQTTYEYYNADSSFNPLSGGAATNAGRTIGQKVYWSVNQGLVPYPLWKIGTQQIAYNGQNEVQLPIDPVNAALVSPSNPLGVSLSTPYFTVQELINKGVFAVNDTSWLNGKLDSLVGFRLMSTLERTYYSSPPPVLSSSINALNFNAGLNYAVLPWLRPYLSVSDSLDPPLIQDADPYGTPVQTARSLGEEAGVKVQDASGRISGSLAFYHTSSKNQEYLITATLLNDINPSGLNGRYGNSDATGWINVPESTEGVSATFTAAPTPNWRMRLSAAIASGRINGTTTYPQSYNDQFNENSLGQVTYADGTVVYVPAAFNSKQLTVAAGTAGATPLTVAMMSSASSPYYANPVAVTGQINAASNAAKVLEVVDPVHGSILTGVAGQPISKIQINPGFTPPGSIVTSEAGDATTGYPEYSLVYTNMYTFGSGALKGFRIGETAQLGWLYRKFYYYPNGVTISGQRSLYYFPNIANFNLIVGYARKLRHVTWSTQVNINNIFNHYHVVILPDPINGWAGVLNATIDQEPRTWFWTNTISY